MYHLGIARGQASVGHAQPSPTFRRADPGPAKDGAARAKGRSPSSRADSARSGLGLFFRESNHFLNFFMFPTK